MKGPDLVKSIGAGPFSRLEAPRLRPTGAAATAAAAMGSAGISTIAGPEALTGSILAWLPNGF